MQKIGPKYPFTKARASDKLKSLSTTLFMKLPRFIAVLSLSTLLTGTMLRLVNADDCLPIGCSSPSGCSGEYTSICACADTCDSSGNKCSMIGSGSGHSCNYCPDPTTQCYAYYNDGCDCSSAYMDPASCHPDLTCESPPPATCPNGVCDSGENCSNCPADCGVCPTAPPPTTAGPACQPTAGGCCDMYAGCPFRFCCNPADNCNQYGNETCLPVPTCPVVTDCNGNPAPTAQGSTYCASPGILYTCVGPLPLSWQGGGPACACPVPTTVPPTTAPATTVPPTTAAPSTVPPTSVAPTTPPPPCPAAFDCSAAAAPTSDGSSYCGVDAHTHTCSLGAWVTGAGCICGGPPPPTPTGPPPAIRPGSHIDLKVDSSQELPGK